MKKPLAIGVAALALAGGIVAVVLVRAVDDDEPAADHGASHPGSGGSATVAATASGLDPLVEEFRGTERAAIQRFNTALREQRENMIDELELSNTIERDVLTPWRALRARVSAAPEQTELYATLRRYLEARQLSWEAYVAGLRADSDEAARPHYEAHRAHNATAHEHARHLGTLFRAAATGSGGL